MDTIGYGDVVGWLRAFAAVVSEKKEFLTELDAAIGDADHGINMNRGMSAALGVIDDHAKEDIGALLKAVAMKLISTVGGASGPLYGTLFLQMSTRTGGASELTAAQWVDALTAGRDGVVARGKAEMGDKTMVDALTPAVDAAREAADAGESPAAVLRASADAAATGVEATIPLVARKGRASYLGERSAGHQDPGATSTYLLLDAAAGAIGAG